jgi:hypothetical protein
MSRSLMRSRSSGFSFMAIMAIALMVVVLVSFSFFNPSSTPIAELKGFSVNPSSVKVGSSSTVSFSLKNDDSANGHYITVIFDTSSSLSFWKGNQPLPIGSDGQPYFTANLEPSQESTFYLTLTGTLPSQTSSTTYPIATSFLVDGKQFSSVQGSITIHT